MPAQFLLWLIDALVILGTLILTIGVIGIYRLPGVYTALHASSLIFILGVLPILLAVILSLQPELVYRAILISAFLLLTSPVTSHVIAIAAYGIQEPQKAPGAHDETGRTAPRQT